MGKRSSAGFTLIELLVVISIVAILAAIIMPVFLNMRRTTRFTTCAQNLKEIGSALALYRAEFGCYPAPPRLDYLQTMTPGDLPYSSERKWDIQDQEPAISWLGNIISKPSDNSVELDSIAGLSSGMLVTLRDTKTGKTEACEITGIASPIITVDRVLKNTYSMGGNVRQASVSIILAEVSDLSNGMVVSLQPSSSWQIDSKLSANSVKLNSLANLSTGMPVKLIDKASGNSESCSIADIDLVNLVVTVNPPLQEAYLQGGTFKTAIPIPREIHEIESINAVNKIVTFNADTFDKGMVNDYSLGGTMAMEPIQVQAQTLDPANREQLILSRVAGLSVDMRVTIYSTKPGGTKTPDIVDQPIITGITGNTLTFNSVLNKSSFTGKEYLTWAVGNNGLATLYELYLTDKKNYLRNFQIFHCPSISATEKVDRGSILMQSGNPAFHAFDPLFAGYNSYDLSYNYDQYEGTDDPADDRYSSLDYIKSFDREMGLSSDIVYRQLKNSNAPADTVVCWCSGHNGVDVTGAMKGLAADTEVERKAAERQVSSIKNLVLFLDGTVSPMSPYALQGNDGRYYWVPPFLYSKGVGR